MTASVVNESGALTKLNADNYVTFSLNGKIQKVHGLAGGTTLLSYIREVAHLRGTKFMCREGGCGACIVTLTLTDPVTGMEKSFGINSCLYAVHACQGMSVTTVEGIGSRQQGYHPVQTRLAQFYGTQCGFCSPGWVMAMYSLLKSNKTFTMKEIEDSFGSNNCRCTGYRPILDAFKSFAEDSPPVVKDKVADIEDLLKVCQRSGKPCQNKCNLHVPTAKYFKCKEEESGEDDLERNFAELALAPDSISVAISGGSQWYRVASVRQVLEIFTMIKGSYMLVGGNTAQGVYRVKYPPPPETYIDINGVVELKSHKFEGGTLVVGANMTLTDTIRLFEAVAVERPADFKYLSVLAKHMKKVAHIPVRNVGTLAGNLSIKHGCHRFPSDLFTIFETVGAKLAIAKEDGSTLTVSLPEYLDTDIYRRLITKIIFFPLKKSYVVRTYKIERRAQNDHAIVNAGFCFGFEKENDYKIIKKPRIVFGGIDGEFIHADCTELFLKGKKLLNNNTLQETLERLNQEVKPTRILPDATNEYRKGLALSLFYRYVLSLNPSAVNPRFRSGGEDIARPLTHGTQEYYSDPVEYPLTEPIPKIESLTQCSGEILYSNDLLPLRDELHASLVLTDRGPATLGGINATGALQIPGVVAFFSAKDIPGMNTILSPASSFFQQIEELFSSGEILYAGQPVGVVVAASQERANFAAERVKITYKDVRKPLLYVKDVLESGDRKRLKYRGSIQPSAEKEGVVHKIEGDFSYNGQYHSYYETHTCVVRPRDNNALDITASTQWIQTVHEAVSSILDISVNRINVQMLRCGGAYGGKINRSNFAACAAALSAYKLQRPVRIVMTLESNMRAFIGRYLMYSEYQVGVNDEGIIKYLRIKYFNDKGASFNESLTGRTTLTAFPCFYDVTTWTVDLYDVLTDKPTTTFLRAPGTLAAQGLVEHIMEHIAWTVKRDPVAVRLSNAETGSPIPQYVTEVKTRADYTARLARCREFNKSNQWKKRGISLQPMKFYVNFRGRFHALVSIYRNDGSVVISHGGTELGQGINTKAVQVAAHVLGIPLDYIKTKPSNNLVSPDNIYTASSTGSDCVCFAVRKCCEELNNRLEIVRNSETPDVAWPLLIQAAYLRGINLSASYMFVKDRDLKPYTNYGATILELEIDCLTGEHRILRVDILQNVGKSISPLVDIGQIEGAFLMGLGHFTCEKLIFDPDTGLLATDRTWEYKIPGAKDIPEDWRLYFKKDPDTPPAGVYGSKSVAEAPLVMSVGVLFAIRRAIESVRRDIGVPNTFFHNDPPCTTENIFLRIKTSFKDYVL